MYKVASAWLRIASSVRACFERPVDSTGSARHGAHAGSAAYPGNYSYRKAIIGSTFAARRAGR